MNKFDINNDNGIKPFFLKGCVLIIAALLVLFVGSMLTLGVISTINKVSPSDLLKGEDREQQAQEEKVSEGEIEEYEQEVLPGEDIELPGLEEKKEGRIITLEEFSKSISEVAKEVKPSVVNIRVRVKRKDSFGEEHIEEGLGSGVIYTTNGYIITNNHVAGEAEALLVTLSNGSQYQAKLVGGDENTDIAVIKIDAKDLETASFTSSDNVEVGEIAIAFGSPFGLQQTITMGIISAKGRNIAISPDILPQVDLIQTDTPINPGNSGGPLVNSSGQVVGINTLIFSPSGTSAGIGFAITSDTSVNIADQIIKYGRARIPFMGIEMGENETDIAGVYVNNVIKGYSAEKAVIKKGDIIVEFDGVAVKTPYELLARILRHNVGDEIQIKIYRDGDYQTVRLELVEKKNASKGAK
jgi:serine protease Do